MKKALITGVAGFAGSHLARYLLTQKITVYGLFHPEHTTTNVDEIRSRINLIPCNLLKKRDLEKTILNIDPDYVFNLAAYSSPAQSFKSPAKTIQNNINTQLNLLESLVKLRSKAKILIVGSSDEYGQPKNLISLDEKTPLAPISPYAVSKVAQDLLGYQFFVSEKLRIIRVRPFNHIGPGQSKAFVIPSFAGQIASLEKKGGGTIKVGNLETWRDFTDVRDMVRAYILALEKGKPGEVYNIGSGKPVRIADILEKLISLSNVRIKIQQDRELFRPVEIQKIYCDFSKFNKQTGWKPQIPISKTLSDTIEYERNILGQKLN